MPSSASAGVKLVKAPFFWAGLAICLAVGAGVAATSSLDVPPEIDHYRDMGAAEALLDGRWGEDPAFVGETGWYPPLLPTLMAVLATLTGKPLTWLYVHIGPLLNAAAPLAFYWLATSLFSRWAATLSLVCYLFLANWNADTWTLASYSPWAWPVLFAQTFFFLALRVWLSASERGDLTRSCLAGVLIGLTFLAHAAPAVLLVVVTLITTMQRGATTNWRQALRGLFAAGSTATLVCAPFLVPLVLRYGLHTQNPIPSRYGGMWLGTIISTQVSLRALGALLGGVWLFSDRRHWAGWGRLSVLAGFGSAAAALVYALVNQKLEARGIELPMLFPPFHFLFYFLAFEALLFGPGLEWLGHRIIRLLAPKLERRVSPGFVVGLLAWKGPLVALTLIVIGVPGFLLRDDYTKWPRESRRLARDERTRAIYTWAKDTLQPQDVVLADTTTSMFGVVAAGHGIVTTYPTMTNPYVALEPREQARDAMYAALRAGEVAEFTAFARRFGVTYVVAGESDEPCCWVNPNSVAGLPRVLQLAGTTIFAIPSED
jgi:hypothetical protein